MVIGSAGFMGNTAGREWVLVLDFGSQYTQLIARRIREIGVYCEVHPYTAGVEITEGLRGVVLSGSPRSVHDANAPKVDFSAFLGRVPVLGICYGAQLLAHAFGGAVERSAKREYGRAELCGTTDGVGLGAAIRKGSVVWMSHGDTIARLPEGWQVLASTESIPIAAFSAGDNITYGVQFHPEVSHSECGLELLRAFLLEVCGCNGDWTLHRAIGDRLTCIFVDHGLLRKGEYAQVLRQYEGMGLRVVGVDAGERFLGALKGVEDPEAKRKIIGRLFVEEFDRAAAGLKGIKWLAQGTIYPDVIESVSVNGPSVTIKSHHNVGGLPKDMALRIVEPLRLLFKDEVRRVGAELGIPAEILGRHPFPGPGLAIRILGEVTRERVLVLQEADAVYVDGLRRAGLYDKIWQAGAILLPVRSVGVMGDERTYESVVALRAVTSVDGMTADWYPIPYEVLGRISNDIINGVRGVNRVVYDVSSKPPATIEWE